MLKESIPGIGTFYYSETPLTDIHETMLERYKGQPEVDGRTPWNTYAREIAPLYGLPQLSGDYCTLRINNNALSLGYIPTQEDWLSGIFKDQNAVS